MITLLDIKQNEDIKALIRRKPILEACGYTDHGPRHVSYVSKTAAGILKSLGYSPREVELAAIAGWVHDGATPSTATTTGRTARSCCCPSSAKQHGHERRDGIITAVGNHEEQSGFISSAVSAALALADKSDAHKTRVRNGKPDPGDIHDRVNFSIQENQVTVDRKTRVIRHELTMDDSSSVLEYLQIYLPRIVMCEQAAAFLKCSFELVINGQPVNNRPHPADKGSEDEQVR
jgi:metal-dependent HD superfamily phosphatase/phosphodiesterase